MSEKKVKETERERAERSPVVWLTVYEAATKRGDQALADRARKELQKLGVFICEVAP